MSRPIWMRYACTTAMFWCVANGAWAQAVEDAASDGEIVVTAQRRDSELQSTAAAVSALSNEALEVRGVSSLESLGVALPGVQIAAYQGDASVFVRGIGTPIIVGGSESSTSTYLDGVYLARPATAAASFFDLESVQVLRGPQGTLYGRNATGGSVLLTSRAPAATFGGEGRLTFGDYGRIGTFLAVEGPLGSDQVLGRIAIQTEQRDGYTTIERPGGATTDVEDRDDLTLRARLQFAPSDALQIDLIGDYYRADDAANVFQYVGRGYADLLADPSTYYTQFFPIIQPWLFVNSTGQQSPPLSRDEYGDLDYFSQPEIWGITGRVAYDFEGLEFVSTTSLRTTTTNFHDDIDLTDAFSSSIERAEDQEQWSQEFLLSSPEEARFSWVLGASYFHDENAVINRFDGPFFPLLLQGLSAQLPFLGIPTTGYASDCCQLRLNGTTDTEALSAFADVRFALTDTLRISAGARYSTEDRGGTQEFGLFNSPAPNALLEALGYYNVATLENVSFDAWTPKVGIEYEPNDQWFFYASAGRGFKSGGFNIGSPQNTPYNPEEITSYELGMRAQLLDRRLRLGLSAFSYDYVDLQVQDSVGQATIIRNAGSADVFGVELEGVVRFTRAFQLDFALSYLDATFGDFALVEPNRPVIYNPFTPGVDPVAAPLIDPNTGAAYVGSPVVGFEPVYGLVPVGAPPGFTPGDPFIQSYQARVSLSGNRLPRAPEWKINIGAQYEADLGAAGMLTFRADYSWQDEIFFSAYNLPTLAQDSFGILNGRVSYDTASSDWRISAFVNNATDEVVLTNGILTGQVYGGIAIGNLLPPRTVGVELSHRF